MTALTWKLICTKKIRISLTGSSGKPYNPVLLLQVTVAPRKQLHTFILPKNDRLGLTLHLDSENPDLLYWFVRKMEKFGKQPFFPFWQIMDNLDMVDKFQVYSRNAWFKPVIFLWKVCLCSCLIRATISWWSKTGLYRFPDEPVKEIRIFLVQINFRSRRSFSYTINFCSSNSSAVRSESILHSVLLL